MVTINEIRAKTGSWTGYVGFFLLVFVWYFLDNIYSSLPDAVTSPALPALLYWVYRLLLLPAIFAGLFGGIAERQRDPESSGLGAFFSGIRKDYWRLLAAHLIYYAVVFIAVIALAIGGGRDADTHWLRTIMTLALYAPLSFIDLAWYAGLVLEHKLFVGLARGVKLLFTNPAALGIAVSWAALSAADGLFFDAPGHPSSLPINAILAAMLAMARVLTVAWMLAIYRQTRPETPEAPSVPVTPFETGAVLATDAAPIPEPSGGDGWVRASAVFACLSFIPLINFVALGLGIVALQRKRRFVFRAAVACALGGFFTVFYFLLVAGLIVGAAPGGAPGTAFLAEANPGIKAQVALLRTSDSRAQLLEQLAADTTAEPARPWTVDCLSALAKYKEGDTSLALADFALAAAKNPERSEFYYYYGRALLDKRQPDAAARQFQLALAHSPRLDLAARYSTLLQQAYQPSPLVSGLLSIFALLVLFTLHELGHAYTAWKLGDDTARNLGRLTLNPIKHLDIVGSILLPGILIFQHSSVVFGWAKPVPINRANLKDPNADQMRVAFAGPAVNLAIVMVCFSILGLLLLVVRMLWPGTLMLGVAEPSAAVSVLGPPMAEWLVYAIVFIKQLMYTSLILGIFNLIPVPPLDGSWILAGLLPGKLRGLFEKVRPFGFVLFLLLVVTPVFDSLLAIPLAVLWAGLNIVAGVLGLG